MRRLVDWTLEDNMVNSLSFYATLIGCRGERTLLVKAGAEMPDISVEVVKPDQGFSEAGSPLGKGTSFGDGNVDSCVIVRPLRIPLVIRPVH